MNADCVPSYAILSFPEDGGDAAQLHGNLGLGGASVATLASAYALPPCASTRTRTTVMLSVLAASKEASTRSSAARGQAPEPSGYD